jgi:TRAP-type uncharacterized transport system substrate-binding protein
MSQRWLWWGLTVALLLLEGCQSGKPPGPPIRAVMATGIRSGYYQKVCLAMREVGQKHGLDITCKTSNGSQANVYLLEKHSENPSDDPSVEFALVQSDVAHRAWKGELPFDEPHQKTIRLVAPLFTEKIHILVRPHQYLTSLAQLKNRRIWLGAENSGSRLSATTVLQAAGFGPADLRHVATSLDSPKALALLRNESGKPGDLVAVVDRPPDQDGLSRTLENMGIKKQLLPPLQGAPSFNVLLAPDFVINNALDLKGQAFQLPKNCCPRQAKQLSAFGLTPVSEDEDMAQALDRLRKKEITALIQPEPLSPEMVCAIMQAQGFTVLPLAADPRTKGQEKLMIFLRHGSTPASAVELAIQGKMKIWWPDHDGTLDEVVLRSLVPDGSVSDVVARREALRRTDRDINVAMAFDLLRAGQLDAVFQTTAAPNLEISKLVNSTEIRFLGIDWPMVEQLDADSSYVETSLQPTAYRVLQQGVYTVGVQTLLLTRLGLEAEDGHKVEVLAQFLRDQQGAIQSKLQDPNPDWPTALTLLGAPLRKQLKENIHDSARRFLVIGHLRPETWLQLSLLGSGILVVGIVGLLLERGRKLCAYHADKILIALACVFYWTIGAIWLQAVEGDVSQDFVSLPAAALSLGRTVLANFRLPTNPPEPTTRDGRLVMGIFSWIGVALVGGVLVPYLKFFWQKKLSPLLEKWRGPQPATPMPAESARSAAA